MLNIEYYKDEIIKRAEHEEPLLTDEEKKILSDLINAFKPFISSEPTVAKIDLGKREYIAVYYNDSVYTPSFDKDNKMFTGLEYNKPYTLEDLGILEKEDEDEQKNN